MPKLLINVSEEQAEWLEAHSDRRVRPGGVSELVRRAIDAYRAQMAEEPVMITFNKRSTHDADERFQAGLLRDHHWTRECGAVAEWNEAQESLGRVAVYWQEGRLHLAYRGTVKTYRGSSVEGCDASDEFVQHLARELKAEVDAQATASSNQSTAGEGSGVPAIQPGR